jgi:hypothetical protein
MKTVAIHKDLLNNDEAKLFITLRNTFKKVGNIEIKKTLENANLFNLLEERLTPLVLTYLSDSPFKDRIFPFHSVELIMQEEADNEHLHYDDRIEENNNLVIAPLVCLLYLNNSGEDFHGGQLYFPFQKAIVEPKVGTLALFPTGHFYPHKVLPFTGGKRYLLKVFYYIDSGLDMKDREYLVKQMKGHHYDHEN